jgi:hypothetical protein
LILFGFNPTVWDGQLAVPNGGTVVKPTEILGTDSSLSAYVGYIL